jgi:hypothetical protein
LARGSISRLGGERQIRAVDLGVVVAESAVAVAIKGEAAAEVGFRPRPKIKS